MIRWPAAASGRSDARLAASGVPCRYLEVTTGDVVEEIGIAPAASPNTALIDIVSNLSFIGVLVPCGLM